MTTLERKPLQTEEILGIIEHVNDDHQPELLLCVRAFTPFDEPADARLSAMYADGVDVEVLQHGELTTCFIGFADAGLSEPDIRALVGAAMKKLGIEPPNASREEVWTVQSNQRFAGCYQRITFDLAGQQREDWEAGYACRFAIPDDEHGRPYTLRRVTGQQAVIDVYIHDATVGSRWAIGLDQGQQVTVKGGRHETFPDFAPASDKGPALLLGDETALPTIAALLEAWNHDRAVRVLLEVGDAGAQRYLDDVCLPRDCHVSWVPRQGAAGESLLGALEGLEIRPAAVWGAMEYSTSKQVRKHLTDDLGLDKKQARVTAYWRKK